MHGFMVGISVYFIVSIAIAILLSRSVDPFPNNIAYPAIAGGPFTAILVVIIGTIILVFGELYSLERAKVVFINKRKVS